MGDQVIYAIFGMEPLRDQESPAVHMVGQVSSIAGYRHTVDRIEYREQNFGDHGIGWFDVYSGCVRIASMTARSLSEVQYQTPA